MALIAACAGRTEAALDAQAEALRRQGKLSESFSAYGRALCASPADLTLALRFVDVWHELGAAGSVRASVAGCALSEGVVAYIDGMALGAQGDHDAAEERLARAEELLGENQRAEVAYRRGLVALAGRKPERLAASMCGWRWRRP